VALGTLARKKVAEARKARYHGHTSPKAASSYDCAKEHLPR
jgi:hypothetical protein